MALARDVADDFKPVGEPHLRHLAQCRVRLLRRRRVHARADTALLRDARRTRHGLPAFGRCPRLAINRVSVGIFAFATFSLGCCANGTVRTAPRLISCGQSPSSASSWACRPASARADRYARNLARLSHAQYEIAPSAKLRQGALPFGRTRCG